MAAANPDDAQGLHDLLWYRCGGAAGLLGSALTMTATTWCGVHSPAESLARHSYSTCFAAVPICRKPCILLSYCLLQRAVPTCGEAVGRHWGAGGQGVLLAGHLHACRSMDLMLALLALLPQCALLLHTTHSSLPPPASCWLQVAPVNDTVKALKDLRNFIRQDTVRRIVCCDNAAGCCVVALGLAACNQLGSGVRRPYIAWPQLPGLPTGLCCPALQPPLADAESIRDAVIFKLFEDLSKQGLDANHPFAAYGGSNAAGEASTSATMQRQPSRLRSLLSLGKRSRKVRRGAAASVQQQGSCPNLMNALGLVRSRSTAPACLHCLWPEVYLQWQVSTGIHGRPRTAVPHLAALPAAPCRPPARVAATCAAWCSR